jgi:serine/threonine protein kinase
LRHRLFKQLPEKSMSLDDYSDLVQDIESPDWVSFRAVNGHEAECRLLVFTPEISANADFRSAWRRDVELFRQLQHDGLPQLQESGDDDGIVYVSTELPSGLTMDDYLSSHASTWDESADLGWQAASVIQHLHNLGIAHGGLDSDRFRISEQLRVSLVDTGVARWMLAAKDPESAGNLNAQYRADLRSLAALLNKLASANTCNSGESSKVPQHWWDLMADLADDAADRFPATAREFQGRLGGILLEDSGDNMVVVADRSAPGQSGRSIVDELLDTPENDHSRDVPQQLTSWSPPWKTVCLLVLIGTVIAVMGAIAFLK